MVKNRIAMLRKEQGMNQRELGERLGVGQTTVSAWETGKNEPDNESMNTMAQLFEVSIGFLAGYEDGGNTRGLTQEQIRAKMDADEREREAETYFRTEEENKRGYTNEEAEKWERKREVQEWDAEDPQHMMYFEAFMFNKMCDDVTKEQRPELLAAAQAVYRAINAKK